MKSPVSLFPMNKWDTDTVIRTERLSASGSCPLPCDGMQDLFSTPFLISCACGQIPLAKSNGAGNWSGCETISNIGSAGAGEQWLCDIPSPAQCASHNWKAFVIWLPFDYDVQDVNPNRTSVTAAEEFAHIEFPGFTSQFRCARLLISRKQYLTVPSLTLVR